MGERAAMPRAAAAAAAISAEKWCPSRFSRKGFSDSIARRRIDRSKAFPSISFADPKAREALIMTYKVPKFVPEFTLSSRGAAADRYVSASYGNLILWNRRSEWAARADRKAETTSLYQSHPWVLALLPDGRALGVLADTTRHCEIDLREGSTIKFMAAAVYPVITFGPFESPTEVLISLSHAIGTIFMPPKWSLGYHQCRWSYNSDAKVLKIARTFR